MRTLPRLTVDQYGQLHIFANQTKDLHEFKRAQTILFLNDRTPISFITQFTGYSRSQIFSLRQLFFKNGVDALRTKAKGEPKRLLTKKQLQEVTTILQEAGSPLRLGYQTPFWTTGMLANYIRDTYHVFYKSKTSYYVIFKKSSFSFHKPGQISSKRDEEVVATWRLDTKEKIEKAWNDQDTVILCEDEAILSTQTTFQKVWLPVNDYPKVETTTKRINKSIYGFLNIKNGKEHAYAFEKQNMYVTVKALQAIRRIYPKRANRGNKLSGKKILLLWDNPGWHRGSKVTEYIEKDGNIEVIYFPKYSPEENPQEHVWKNAKGAIVHNRFLEHIEQETKEFLIYLNNTKFFYKLLDLSPVS